MNNIRNDMPSNDEVVCETFTNTMVALFDLNEADTSATFYNREVISESIDKSVWLVLDSQLADVDMAFKEAEDYDKDNDDDDDGKSKGKKKNIFVRAWLKLKEWIKSFWNWITGKKGKKNDEAVSSFKDEIFKDEPAKAKKIDKESKKHKKARVKIMKLVNKVQHEVDAILSGGGNLNPGFWGKVKGGLKTCMGMSKNGEVKIANILKKVKVEKMTDAERNDVVTKLLRQYDELDANENTSEEGLRKILIQIKRIQPDD